MPLGPSLSNRVLSAVVLLALVSACDAEATPAAVAPTPSRVAAEPPNTTSTAPVDSAAPTTTQPLSREATARALADAASGLGSCKKDGGPTGPGKVRLTFETNGTVSAVSLLEGPFAGTATGDCVLERFRQTRIPPFGGTAVPVNKSFMVR